MVESLLVILLILVILAILLQVYYIFTALKRTKVFNDLYIGQLSTVSRNIARSLDGLKESVAERTGHVVKVELNSSLNNFKMGLDELLFAFKQPLKIEEPADPYAKYRDPLTGLLSMDAVKKNLKAKDEAGMKTVHIGEGDAN